MTVNLLIANEGVEVEARRLRFAKRLRDRHGAVKEQIPRGDHVDLYAPRHERAQREQRLERADAGPGDDDAPWRTDVRSIRAARAAPGANRRLVEPMAGGGVVGENGG